MGLFPPNAGNPGAHLGSTVRPSDCFAEANHALKLTNRDTIGISSGAGPIVLAKDPVFLDQKICSFGCKLFNGIRRQRVCLAFCERKQTLGLNVRA